MIHVCFALYDKTERYSKFTGTAMLSLLENTNAKVTVHILHDNTLSPDNRDKFSYVAGQYNQRVEFHNVEILCADRIAKIAAAFPRVNESIFTVAMFYRFFIPHVLPVNINKIIYLDSDIIVNLDIAELWRVELGNKILGVVPEISNRDDVEKILPLVADGLVKIDDYFNSGVLLMNLNVLRGEEETILRGIKFIGENPQYNFFDQDILNYCFSTRSLKLPVKFNRFAMSARQATESINPGKIYHYIARTLNFDTNDPFNRLWIHYFMQTPWFDEIAMARLYAGVQNIHVELKRSMVNISAIMSGKTRAFFDVSRNVDALKKIFAVRTD